MPRAPRICTADGIYHVLNRASGRAPLFETDADYAAFESVLEQAQARTAMRLLAYLVMPNHWHLVLWPRADGDVSAFMGWLTMTHTQRWHVAHDSVGSGHLYQGRYKSFPVQDDNHALTVCRYVECNALRAGLVTRAEDWHWSSLWRRCSGDAAAQALLTASPIDLGPDWLDWVNAAQTAAELDDLRRCVNRGRPYGSAGWTANVVERLGLGSTLRPVGRPRK